MSHATKPWKVSPAVQDNGPNYFVVSDGQWRTPAIGTTMCRDHAVLLAWSLVMLNTLRTVPGAAELVATIEKELAS